MVWYHLVLFCLVFFCYTVRATFLKCQRNVLTRGAHVCCVRWQTVSWGWCETVEMSDEHRKPIQSTKERERTHTHTPHTHTHLTGQVLSNLISNKSLVARVWNGRGILNHDTLISAILTLKHTQTHTNTQSRRCTVISCRLIVPMQEYELHSTIIMINKHLITPHNSLSTVCFSVDFPLSLSCKEYWVKYTIKIWQNKEY